MASEIPLLGVEKDMIHQYIIYDGLFIDLYQGYLSEHCRIIKINKLSGGPNLGGLILFIFYISQKNLCFKLPSCTSLL